MARSSRRSRWCVETFAGATWHIYHRGNNRENILLSDRDRQQFIDPLSARLIDEILDVSRILTGKARLNPAAIDLREIMFAAAAAHGSGRPELISLWQPRYRRRSAEARKCKNESAADGSTAPRRA